MLTFAVQQVRYCLQHRHRFLKDAVEIANVKLIEDGHEPAHVTPHGLRRMYTSLLFERGGASEGAPAGTTADPVAADA